VAEYPFTGNKDLPGSTQQPDSLSAGPIFIQGLTGLIC
jgi:hypothetical protein